MSRIKSVQNSSSLTQLNRITCLRGHSWPVRVRIWDNNEKSPKAMSVKNTSLYLLHKEVQFVRNTVSFYPSFPTPLNFCYCHYYASCWLGLQTAITLTSSTAGWMEEGQNKAFSFPLRKLGRYTSQLQFVALWPLVEKYS